MSETGQKQGAEPIGRAARPRPGRRSFVLIALVLLLAGLAYVGYTYWVASANYESTDDAYIDGRAVIIAPRISGAVVSLDVSDNQFVHKGDPLIHIDPRQYLIDRESAEASLKTAKGQLAAYKYLADVARKNFPAAFLLAQAQLASANANLINAKADYKRQMALPGRATTQQDIDTATAKWRQAEAQVQQAEAQVQEAEPVKQRIGQADSQVSQITGQVGQAQAKVDQANLNLLFTIVRAPQDGWVTKRNVEVGDYVTPGQQIMSLVAPELWVIANFKETELTDMRPGQRATISVDAYPSLRLVGHVDSIQRGTGAKFTAFPPENATGNFVKIVQRVPVKIVIDKGLDPRHAMPLGLSVGPRVKVQ
ncbi:putative multidrug resistance protein EmrK [Methylovirgula sp. HY1]|nr:putative multidrug resistance protein EmrK [Methylovirgula sp. HY1]